MLYRSPAPVAVPNVVGLTQAAATTAITNVGLVLGTVTTAASGTVASGSVISSTPVAGTQVAAGSAVNLVVSSGPAPMTGKSATQSSTFQPASRAVDGNTDGNLANNSVAHTYFDSNAWWQVDLGAQTPIGSVVVWNRTDCCGSRLSDYWVFVSNTPFLATDTPATLQNRAGTFSSHQTTAPGPSAAIAIGGAVGQYVRIQLSGADYLQLAEVQVFSIELPNLSAGKTATQSSTFQPASRAVDGNTDGNLANNSVSHTYSDANAWWQVDLGTPSLVNSVVIWNRTDCCASRLADYWVFVSNNPFVATDTPATLQNRAGTWNSHQTSAPNPSAAILAGGAQGRYVRVQLSGTDYLNLAEVQVYGTPLTNLAQGRTASQSSTFQPASRAVDGNTDGNLANNSVSHTYSDANAWRQVDLGSQSSVSAITIWNRTDCCGSRLSDYWVFVSATPFNASDTPAVLQNRAGVWSTHQTSAPGPSATLVTGGVTGQYVRVQLSGTDYLNLAEVQVFGTPLTNLSAGKTAAQSSTLRPASAAVDGNTDGNLANNSVSHTYADANAWWQVDLGSQAIVNSIAVWNRTDCCGSRLADYWVFVSDTPFSPSDTPATLQSRTGVYASHQTLAPGPVTAIVTGGVVGQYVRVQLAGTDYLQLAEVQVFGTPVTNVAQGKPASQSSTFKPASAAVDGNTDGNLANNSVAHTNADANAWWQVDIGPNVTVSAVTVWNRTDCCGSRLADYWVFVSNTPFLASDTPATLQSRAGTFASHQIAAPNPAMGIVTGGVQGRYVRVQLSGTDYLQLAEVQVQTAP